MKSVTISNKKCSEFQLVSLAINIIHDISWLEVTHPELVEIKKVSNILEKAKHWNEVFSNYICNAKEGDK